MFPAPFGHIKIKHHHHRGGWGSSSSSSSDDNCVNKAWKKEQKRQRKAMKHMAKHVSPWLFTCEYIMQNPVCSVAFEEKSHTQHFLSKNCFNLAKYSLTNN